MVRHDKTRVVTGDDRCCDETGQDMTGVVIRQDKTGGVINFFTRLFIHPTFLTMPIKSFKGAWARN